MSAIGVCKSIEREAEMLRARCEVNGLPRDCRVSQLHEGGLFVESFVPAVTGSSVNLSFQLPNGHQVITTGVVSRHQFKLGFQVDFDLLSSTDREQITSFARR